MGGFKGDHFCSLLGSADKLAAGLPAYLVEIERNNIEYTFGAMQELVRAIRVSVDPMRKVNATAALLQCIEVGTYPALLFAEIYVLPVLTKVVDFLLHNREFHQIANYFEKNGHSSTIPHIQNLSYNFVALTCQFFERGAIIKPFRVHEGLEYEEPSLFRRWNQKLAREKASIALSDSQSKNNTERIRQRYLDSLIRWVDYSDSLIYFFIEMLQVYFQNDNSDIVSPLFDVLQYGESNITEETIARLIDIIAYHLSFDIRIKALRLLDRMVLWGDVEALLVINYTENTESIIKAFWQVRGEKSLEEGKHIYPEINGQQAKKLEFYQLFLTCFQSWAVSFPSQQFLAVPANVKDPSPIYQLYKLLRQRKNTIFPVNSNLVRYETQARMAMLERTFRNRLIVRDINNQSQLHSVSIVVEHQIKDVQEFYDTHKQILVNLISRKSNPYEAMEKLADFQLHFEEMLESMSLEEEPGPSLDKLIENGLELIEIVTLVHAPFLQLLHGELTEKEFFEKIMNQCINYFSPTDENPFSAFYSERVAHKKDSLVEMLRLQKSDPLEKDLKYITNSIMVKQFRHKYRQKLEKLSSSRNSEQSDLNLQIFTKTKFTRESREEMDGSFKIEKKERVSPVKPELKVKNGITPKGGASLKSSREKKKLSLASIEVENRKRDPIQMANQNRIQYTKKANRLEASSDTRSSRDQDSQKSLKPVDRHISFQENSQYFSFMPNETYKFSYVCPHMLIFKSPFLTVERHIAQDAQNPLRIKIDLILTTHKQLVDFEYAIEDQECIKLEHLSAGLPPNLASNCQFKIEIAGEMRKIPLRLPVIAMFIRKRIFFQYILPFTFNFFLTPHPQQAIECHHRLKNEAKHRYYTSNLILSGLLFPQLGIADLSKIIPGTIKLPQAPQDGVKHLLLASYGKLLFLFVFEYYLSSKTLLIRGYDAKRNDDYNESMLIYAVNLLAHLLGEREC